VLGCFSLDKAAIRARSGVVRVEVTDRCVLGLTGEAASAYATADEQVAGRGGSDVAFLTAR
jgi:hypothetical protein